MQTQIKIVLVGRTSQPRTRIARDLLFRHSFTRFRMIEGVNKIYKDLYGPGTKTDKITPSRKHAIYDAIYANEPDAFLSYLKYRVVRTDKHIVVEDPRFVAEVNYLHDVLGFCIVRVTDMNPAANAGPRLGVDALPGMMKLYEHFPSSVGYKAYYNLPWHGDKEKDRNRKIVDQMVESLKLGWK